MQQTAFLCLSSVRGVMAALVLAVSLPFGSAWAQGEQAMAPQKLPAVPLRAGMHTIKAEVALTPQQHTIGLMARTSMGPNEGMLFVFPQSTRQCFWMKNTLIPLSIAFLTDDGSVVNIDEMQPRTEATHCSTQPVRYVLEMNKGWFAKRGVKPGVKLTGEPFGSK